MDKILLFEPREDKREALTRSIRACLNHRGQRHTEFLCFTPEDVFSKPLPQQAGAAFFTLSCMYDAEAARKFSRIRGKIPLVVVCDSEEYAPESWRCGASYYLTRPIPKDELGEALRRCELYS